MKLFVYAMRDFDELPVFEQLSAEHGFEFGWSEQYCTMETADLSRGYDVISATPRTLDRALLTKLHDNGVSVIATRSVGTDHIDLAACRDLGMGVSCANYEPQAVADYAIMLMLMCARRMPQTMARSGVQDYTLRGKLGRDITRMTVGIVGTGRIGATLAKHLSGFGCRLLGYDPYRNPSLEGLVEYMELDELLAQSDIVSVHAPATPENYHLMNERTLGLMKPGAFLVNTARGTLVDTEALICALESGHLGGAALDVLEQEAGLYYANRTGDVIENRHMAILRAFPNVILTPHTAFYTDVSMRQMAETVVEGALAIINGSESRLVVQRP